MTAESAFDPFFVVGSDRSGTTMLMFMLDESPHFGVSRESWFLSNLMDALPLNGPLSRDQVKQAFSIISSHPRWQHWGLPPAELEAALGALEEPDLATVIDATFRLDLARSGKPRWGDKTPGYVTEVKRLRQVFPRAKFVHMIRDARDVCISLGKVGWRGNSLHARAQYWNRNVGAGIRDGRALGPDSYLEIIYEELAQDVETGLRRICTFLDEPFEEGMLTWHERALDKTTDRPAKYQSKLHRSPRPSDLQRWRKELTLFQVATVEVFAGNTMKLAGQRLRFEKGLGWLRILARFAERVQRRSRRIFRSSGLLSAARR